jgi:hypothetical protein
MCCDDLLLATKRAREVVGDGVWAKLSDRARKNAIRDELRIISAERAAKVKPVVDRRDDVAADPVKSRR